MERQFRSNLTNFEAVRSKRSDSNDEELHIQGYFSVFNENYQIGEGMSESIAEGAFTDTINDDVRALIDHDTRLVLGRTKANTLYLEQRDKGLWGDITINPKDTDATNLYARVERGDVNQCSFGFEILSEHYDMLADDSVHWTIDKVKLYEVSVCTFPAYESTEVQVARSKDLEEIKKRKNDEWKIQMKAKMKGVNKDGIESVNVEKKN